MGVLPRSKDIAQKVFQERDDDLVCFISTPPHRHTPILVGIVADAVSSGTAMQLSPPFYLDVVVRLGVDILLHQQKGGTQRRIYRVLPLVAEFVAPRPIPWGVISAGVSLVVIDNQCCTK